jgi:hypothetical protein
VIPFPKTFVNIVPFVVIIPSGNFVRFVVSRTLKAASLPPHSILSRAFAHPSQKNLCGLCALCGYQSFSENFAVVLVPRFGFSPSIAFEPN